MKKTVGRRSFLKIMGAAPVAAPAAAKASVLELEKSLGGNLLGASSANASIGPPIRLADHGTPVEYLQEELKNLVRQRGEAADRNEHGYDYDNRADTAAFIEIDGLRSISPVNRARMISRCGIERAKAREMSWIDRRIEKIKQELGPLGMLF